MRGLPRVRPGAAQGVQLADGVAFGHVDAPAVGRRAVLYAAVAAVPGRADDTLPGDLPGGGVDRPVDAALLADAAASAGDFR
jgi:hypothetical protein